MTLKILTVTNRKGGVGKTTLAVHAAFGLAKFHGLRVGLIDADPQGSVSDMIGIEPSDGLYRLMVNGAALEDVAIDCNGVMVIPGSYKTQQIAGEIEQTNIFAFADLCAAFADRGAYRLY